MTTAQPVLTIGPYGGRHIYKSASAASRALSGDGSNRLRNTIIRRLDNNGGYIGNVWVQSVKRR